MSAFQTTFSVGLQVSGSAGSSAATPADSPRNRGQSSAPAETATTASATRPTVRRTERGNFRFAYMEENVPHWLASVHSTSCRPFDVFDEDPIAGRAGWACMRCRRRRIASAARNPFGCRVRPPVRHVVQQQEEIVVAGGPSPIAAPRPQFSYRRGPGQKDASRPRRHAS
jgi:hypothetical protein